MTRYQIVIAEVFLGYWDEIFDHAAFPCRNARHSPTCSFHHLKTQFLGTQYLVMNKKQKRACKEIMIRKPPKPPKADIICPSSGTVP